MPVNTGYLSADTTVFSNISLSGEASHGGGQLSAGTVAVPLGFSATFNTAGGLSLGTYSFSITTAAAATSIPDNHLGLVFRASGISLVYVSGGTVYSFGSSGVGASFASGTA